MTWFHGVPLLLIGALIGPAIRAAGVRHLNLSFKKEFTRTNDPKVGNVAVFTCYDKQTNESIGLGHVAFVREKPRSKQVKLIGGNTAADGHSSIICKRYFETSGRNVRRRIGGNWVECIMRLNTYVEVS